MTHLITRSKEQLLVIYGGRNDAIFEQTSNLDLNDVCIYNINRNTWEALAIFGQKPCSRWSHIITQVRGDTKDSEEGFLMFGGANLKSYCRTGLWNLKIIEGGQQMSKGQYLSGSRDTEEVREIFQLAQIDYSKLLSPQHSKHSSHTIDSLLMIKRLVLGYDQDTLSVMLK